MTDLRTFDQITAADVDAVGGKGLSLGLMAGAGLLPVVDGHDRLRPRRRKSW